MERILPNYRISAFGYSMSLNPGPFNIKEHALIAIMVFVPGDGAAITDIASAMHILYGVRWPIGKQFLLGLCFQLLGFSFAGILRQFLVWPSSMIWPGVLVRCALLNTMHSNYGKKDTKHISRERFLYIAFLCSFVWYWVPGYLWTGLSVFNWVCWIAPNNVVVNSLFGSLSGLGMGLVSFDWVAISAIGSPLVVPVCSDYMPKYDAQSLQRDDIVLGAAQHVGRVFGSDLVHKSDHVGCVYSTSSVFRLLFILRFSQERLVFAVHADVCGHFV